MYRYSVLCKKSETIPGKPRGNEAKLTIGPDAEKYERGETRRLGNEIEDVLAKSGPMDRRQIEDTEV